MSPEAAPKQATEIEWAPTTEFGRVDNPEATIVLAETNTWANLRSEMTGWCASTTIKIVDPKGATPRVEAAQERALECFVAAFSRQAFCCVLSFHNSCSSKDEDWNHSVVQLVPSSAAMGHPETPPQPCGVLAANALLGRQAIDNQALLQLHCGI